jgi:hypothetical protein
MAMIDVRDVKDGAKSIHRARITKFRGYDESDLEATAHHIFDVAIKVHQVGWTHPALYHKDAKRGKLKDLSEGSVEARLAKICECLRSRKATVDDSLRGGIPLALLCDNPYARCGTKESNNTGNAKRGKRLGLIKKKGLTEEDDNDEDDDDEADEATPEEGPELVSGPQPVDEEEEEAVPSPELVAIAHQDDEHFDFNQPLDVNGVFNAPFIPAPGGGPLPPAFDQGAFDMAPPYIPAPGGGPLPNAFDQGEFDMAPPYIPAPAFDAGALGVDPFAGLEQPFQLQDLVDPYAPFNPQELLFPNLFPPPPYVEPAQPVQEPPEGLEFEDDEDDEEDDFESLFGEPEEVEQGEAQAEEQDDEDDFDSLFDEPAEEEAQEQEAEE